MLPALLRPAAALGGAGADKITLHVGEAAEHREHQPPGAVIPPDSILWWVLCSGGLSATMLCVVLYRFYAFGGEKEDPCYV